MNKKFLHFFPESILEGMNVRTKLFQTACIHKNIDPYLSSKRKLMYFCITCHKYASLEEFREK